MADAEGFVADLFGHGRPLRTLTKLEAFEHVTDCWEIFTTEIREAYLEQVANRGNFCLTESDVRLAETICKWMVYQSDDRRWIDIAQNQAAAQVAERRKLSDHNEDDLAIKAILETRPKAPESGKPSGEDVARAGFPSFRWPTTLDPFGEFHRLIITRRARAGRPVVDEWRVHGIKEPEEQDVPVTGGDGVQ